MPSLSTAKAFQRRDETIVHLLGTIQRHRDLTTDESALLERTVRRITPKREIWRWSAEEDALLIAISKKRARTGKTRPFQRNDEIRDLAQQFGRTEWAVYRRLERLRKVGKAPKAERFQPGPGKGRPAYVRKVYDFTGTVSVAEAAIVLKVSEEWLKRLRLVGGGPNFVKMGHHVRYPIETLQRFPVQQIKDENDSRARAWLASTAAMDETGIGMAPIVQDASRQGRE